MAKSSGFFGLRRGSTKSLTFSVLKGTQVTKDRVTDVANPKTMSQTEQRIPFAQAVKFYKHATKALFKFAFEDKKSKESDYNAYMRHNVKNAASVSLENYNNPNYPALGKWQLTQGEMTDPEYTVIGLLLNLGISPASSNLTTIGSVSALILSKYPNLVEGDIVTFVLAQTKLMSDGSLTDDYTNQMIIKQFVLNVEDSTTLQSIGLNEVASGEDVLSLAIEQDDSANAGAVIFSRKTPDGLKVSNAILAGNEIWDDVLEGKMTPTARKEDAINWGARDAAILEGALVQ